MKNSLLLICALLLCNSCSEDDVPTISVGNFESTAMIKNDPVVLYTKGKVITDDIFIRTFLERNQIAATFDFPAGSATSPIHAVFNNSIADSAYLRYTSNASGKEFIFNQVYYDNNTAVFVGRDSLWIPTAEDGELSCTNAGPRIRKHPLLTYCAPIGNFGEWICKARFQVPIVMNGNDIAIPIITYHFSNKTQASLCGIGEQYIFGQLNEDALKTIHTEDTLVIQTRMLVLEKK